MPKLKEVKEKHLNSWMNILMSVVMDGTQAKLATPV